MLPQPEEGDVANLFAKRRKIFIVVIIASGTKLDSKPTMNPRRKKDGPEKLSI